jgi:uncharacterized protein YjbJ (UPF0337 family)
LGSAVFVLHGLSLPQLSKIHIAELSLFFVILFHRGDFASFRLFRLFTGDQIMNKDQVKGATKEVAGKVQQQAGKLVGSEEQQAKGIGKQVAGNVQKNVGNAKETVKDSLKKNH